MMNKYITSVPTVSTEHSNIGKYRKEKHFNYSLIVCGIKDGNIKTPIEARFYRTPRRLYCCVWINFISDNNTIHLRGGAYASGGGYHKGSTSLECALLDCGVKVEKLEGRGDSAMESALLELAETINNDLNLGYSNFTVIKAHG